MKRIIFTSTFLVAAVVVTFAQSWQKFNYQGVARDAQGEVIENQAIGIRISLHEGTALGTVVYQETHASTTNEFGLFDLAIGGGTVVSGDFSTIDWGADNFFVQVEMDPAGGTNYADMGTSELLSVPYAMYAVNAGVPGVTGATGPQGPIGLTGATGPTGPLVAGATNETLRAQAGTWEASSNLSNTGTNVGVGLLNPAAKLHVSANGSEIARFQSSGGSKWISLYEDGTRKGILWSRSDDMVLRNDDATGNVVFQTNGNNDRLTINSTGNVGVGITTPLAQLHVENSLTRGIFLEDAGSGNYWNIAIGNNSNNFKFGYNTPSTYVAEINNSTGAYVQLSDKRLKKNFEQTGPVLTKVMELKPLKYHYNTNTPDATKSWGFIAQEVEQVLPEFVSTDMETGYKGMMYDQIAVLAIKAIQEQQVLIEQLQAEIEMLKSE